jgi:iron(III) transport system substrate-binding protein
MMRAWIAVWLALAAPALATGPEAVAEFGAPGAPRTLLVRGSTDIAAFGPVLAEFAGATVPGVAVRYEQWGSNALYAATAEACEGGAEAADLVISSAVDLQVKLVNDGCARPHRSALTDALAPELNWRDELFGVTREPAVMVYNRDLVPAEDAPRSRFDLLDLLRPDRSRYAGRVATYDIEASGLGYLFAYLDSQQATTFGSLLEAFGRAGAVATCCTAEILDAVAEGRYLIGYNLLGSYALARAAVDPRIAVVAPSDYTLVLARAAMIPRGARAPEAAAALIDFMLSPPGRRALAGSRLVVDIGGEDGGELAASPDGATALRPVALSPVLIVGLDAHKRRLFIELWRDALHQSAGEAP